MKTPDGWKDKTFLKLSEDVTEIFPDVTQEDSQKDLFPTCGTISRHVLFLILKTFRMFWGRNSELRVCNLSLRNKDGGFVEQNDNLFIVLLAFFSGYV